MRIETERLVITEFTPDMAQAVHENSLDEDNRRFVPDEVFETVEDAEETVAFLINQFGTLLTEGHFAAGFIPGLIAEICMVAAVVLIGRKVRAHFDEQYELHKGTAAAKATA